MRTLYKQVRFNFLCPTTIVKTSNKKGVYWFSRKIMSEFDQPSTFDQPRLVLKKITPTPQSEGVGAVARRCIGGRELDPFIGLDDFEVTPPGGFPDHPHRGFETVTYMLQGTFKHQDFAGHKGVIRPGDLQWMTAGRGIIHSEMPTGVGLHRGLQLWVNLSSKDKMIEPNYQDLHDENIPRAKKDGVEVKVIAGESMGIRSQVYTRTPTMYLDFTLQPGAHHDQPIPRSWNGFAYVLEGEGVFCVPNSKPVAARNLLVLGAGEGLSVWNKSSKPLRFLLVCGQPINEPVAQYGPFVMNTQAEIQQAIEDYHYCKNGFENARHWRAQ